jgi:hypothetical protein
VGPTGTAGVVNVKATQAQPDSVTAASRVAIDAALLLLLLLLLLQAEDCAQCKSQQHTGRAPAASQ